MQQQEDPGRLAILEDLRRSALETYGEERTAESALQLALEQAATAVWRVSSDSLDPMDESPLPTHA